MLPDVIIEEDVIVMLGNLDSGAWVGAQVNEGSFHIGL